MRPHWPKVGFVLLGATMGAPPGAMDAPTLVKGELEDKAYRK